MKKQQLNGNLYNLHLQLANEWGNMWPYIQETIDTKLSRITSEYCCVYIDYKIKPIIAVFTLTTTIYHN
jgi:hypothetical protein